jgi:hypothetical protein
VGALADVELFHDARQRALGESRQAHALHQIVDLSERTFAARSGLVLLWGGGGIFLVEVMLASPREGLFDTTSREITMTTV